MKGHEKAPGYGGPGASETRRQTISSTMVHTAAATEKPAACDVRWMQDFAGALDDRTLTSWALRLENVDRVAHPHAYLWQQIARIELRRRHRNVDVTTLDNCPACGVVGRWWRNRRTGGIVCLACGRDGGAS